MKLEIEISEDELKEAVLKVVSNNYYRDYSADRNHVNRVVAEQVRRVIYEDKERIIDRIVAQASRECRSKALKKILEMAGEDE